MERLKVHASREYEVVIGDSILNLAGSYARQFSDGNKAFVISDDRVFSLYGIKVFASLENFGFSVIPFIFPEGEKSKNTGTLVRLWEYAAENHMSRSDIFIALGGGVAGDLAGFGASTYMRGINFINIPTSLLSMVDSSVGGKTAVDLTNGKNLAGTFYQPCAVICDTSVLKTLKNEKYSEGMAEVIKYGMINSPEILSSLHDDYNISDIVKMCIEDKAYFVNQDEKDRGIRQLLNFGHTAGHAIEKCSDYRISHGEAVSMGMHIMTRAAVKTGMAPYDTSDILGNLTDSFMLPSKCPFSADKIYENILNDKKVKGDKITLVIPESVGKCVLKDLDLKEAYNFMKEGL